MLIGLIASLLVFFLNLRINLYTTSLIRGIIAFGVFYLLGALFYFSLYIISPKNESTNHKVNLNIGTDFNMDEIYQTSKESTGQNEREIKDLKVDFEPLELKKIKLSNN